MTTEQIDWVKMNSDMLISILKELRVETLEQLSSADETDIKGLQFMAGQLNGTINNIENLVKVKPKRKGKTFTGI